MTTINSSAAPTGKSKTWIIIALVGLFSCICIVVVGVVLGLGYKKGWSLSNPLASIPTQASVSIPTQEPILIPTAALIPASTDTPIPTTAPTSTPPPPQSISVIVDALKVAAEGRAVPEAAAYDPKKSGIHPIVFYSASKEIADEWNAELPDAWRGQSVGLTELVAVLINHEVVVEQARYTAKGMGIFFLSRIRTDTEVILREARTGQIVSTATFPGGEPPTLKSGYDQIITAVYGTLVPYEIVEIWLESFVEK